MPFCWWQETKAELTRPISLFKLWYTSQPHRSLADTTRLLLQWLMRHSLPVNASSETRNGTSELTQCRTSHCCKTQKIKMVTWGLSRMCGKIPGRRRVQRNPYSFIITFIKVVVLSLQQILYEYHNKLNSGLLLFISINQMHLLLRCCWHHNRSSCGSQTRIHTGRNAAVDWSPHELEVDHFDWGLSFALSEWVVWSGLLVSPP